MKKLIILILSFIISLSICSCRSADIRMEVFENLRTFNYQENKNENNAIVVYYSKTGNTQQVARTIAVTLKCPMVYIEDVKNFDLSIYNLLIIGSPVYAGCPAKEIRDFILDTNIKKPAKCAIFCTWGAPGWGPTAAKSVLDYMRKNIKSECIGEFNCPGFHQLLRTYSSRPNKEDLNKAVEFAKGLIH